MASSNGQVFFDPLAKPDSEESSSDLALAAGGSYLKYIYQQSVRLQEDFQQPGIDIPYTADKIDEQIEGSEYPPTHVILNFEHPFQSAIGRLGQGNPPGSNDTQEDLDLRQELIDLIVVVKSRNPGIKFAYYRAPNHRSDFIANTSVANLVENPDVERTVNGVTRLNSEWLQARIEERWLAEGPLCEVSDFMAPSGYDRYPLGVPGSTTRGNPLNEGVSDDVLLSREQNYTNWGLAEHEALRNNLVMGVCQYIRQQLGRPFMPILPHVNHYYIHKTLPYAADEFFMASYVQMDDYIEKQVKPYMDGGATSIIQWGADQFVSGKPFDHTRLVDTSLSYQNNNDQLREFAVLEFPEIFGFEEPVDRINDWRSVDWYLNGSPNAGLRDALRIAMRDKRLEYIRRASQFVKTYGAARASTLAALA